MFATLGDKYVCRWRSDLLYWVRYQHHQRKSTRPQTSRPVVDEKQTNTKTNLIKAKGLLFGTKQLLQNSSDFILQIQGKDIYRLSWGLDEQLHWKEHTDSICNKVNKRLELLAWIRPCLTLKAAMCAYNTLIELILCYTNTTWGELSSTPSKTLERLQNRAACIVFRCDSTKDTFNVLGWLS